MAQLSAGEAAPKFSLLDDGGKQVSLDELHQGKLVLYFFPKANTTG